MRAAGHWGRHATRGQLRADLGDVVVWDTEDHGLGRPGSVRGPFEREERHLRTVVDALHRWDLDVVDGPGPLAVLDLGCGAAAGLLAVHVSAARRSTAGEFRYVGYDHNPDVLEAGRRLATSCAVPGLGRSAQLCHRADEAAAAVRTLFGPAGQTLVLASYLFHQDALDGRSLWTLAELVDAAVDAAPGRQAWFLSVDVPIPGSKLVAFQRRLTAVAPDMSATWERTVTPYERVHLTTNGGFSRRKSHAEVVLGRLWRP